jgi:hypothetical protein
MLVMGPRGVGTMMWTAVDTPPLVSQGSDFNNKTDAISGEGPGDWATYQLRECSETAEGVARESKGVKSCPRAGCGKSARPVRWVDK